MQEGLGVYETIIRLQKRQVSRRCTPPGCLPICSLLTLSVLLWESWNQPSPASLESVNHLENTSWGMQRVKYSQSWRSLTQSVRRSTKCSKPVHYFIVPCGLLVFLSSSSSFSSSSSSSCFPSIFCLNLSISPCWFLTYVA